MSEAHREWGIVIHDNPLRISIITEKMKEWLREHGHRGLCMDDTFHSTKYNLKLLIVSVLDDVDRSLPVGFLFSSHMTSADVSVLLQRLKEEVGEIRPSVLMTDDTMVFWNAFISVFPACENITRKLLCMFHVIQSVKRKAPQKISDKEKVKRVVASFRSLTKEPSAPRFVTSLMNLMEWLKKEKENDFLSYLKTHYLGEERIKQWAPYFRQDSPLNVNMGLERMNEQLKNGNLKRRAGNSRLDHSIYQCVQLSLQIEERHLTADMRNKVGGRRRLLMTHSRHQSALDDYSKEGVTQSNQNVWRINSKSDKKRMYRVERKFDCPCKTAVNNHCSRCLACPYVWQCSCADSTKSGVCCVHVHAAIMYTEVGEDQEAELVAVTDTILVIPENEQNEDEPGIPTLERRNEDEPLTGRLVERVEGREEREEADGTEIFDMVTHADGDSAADAAVQREDRERERRTKLDTIHAVQFATLRRMEKEGNEEETDRFLSRLEELTREFSTHGFDQPVAREGPRQGRPCNALPIRGFSLISRAQIKREQKKSQVPPEPITFNRRRDGTLCSICKEQCPPTVPTVKKRKGEEGEGDSHRIWCSSCKNWAHTQCLRAAKGNLERCAVCEYRYNVAT